MKSIVKVSSVFLVIFIHCAGCSSKQKNGSEIIIDKFFSKYESDIAVAIEELFSTNSYIDNENEAVLNLKEQLNETVLELGDYYGSELINTHNAGASSSLIISNYLVKYERQPIRFQFTFYKPNERWMIYNFKYDTDLNDELITSSQLFFLNETFMNKD